MANNNETVFSGIDGGNPLGFLAAVGAATLSRQFSAEARLFWRPTAGAWRPVLAGYDGEPEAFVQELGEALASVSTDHFEIDKRLPFEAEKFSKALAEAQPRACLHNRRYVDFLASFGSEVVQDKGVFKDTPLRMVRSGDAAGQGFPHYAQEIRRLAGASELWRTLFEPWDYRDDGFSLRWDPLEDQRYALRWKNPSKSSLADGPGTMLGANALALEALQLFPTAPRSGHLLTTGFHQNRHRQTFFTWPIWDRPASVEILRSLLALAELREESPPRKALARRGIVEIYRCQRIAQNQYYSNFAPAHPA